MLRSDRPRCVGPALRRVRRRRITGLTYPPPEHEPGADDERPSTPDAAFTLAFATASLADDGPATSPDRDLPPHITRLTLFGERADFSHDGKRVLFLEKTFGDVYEVDLETRKPRLLTGHYPHHGYTRALYLANGDILLSGPERLDPEHPGGRPRPVPPLRPRQGPGRSPGCRWAPSAPRGRPSRAKGCTSPGPTSRPSILARCLPAARASSRPTSSTRAARPSWRRGGWSSTAATCRSAARWRPRTSGRRTSAS